MADATDVTLLFGDEEMGVHSQVLSLASQMFASTLASPMAEAGTKRIKVDVSGRKKFTEFYKFINPQTSRISEVTKDNVDAVVILADYYQVEHLKRECEEFLLSLEPSVDRLLQADERSLKRQYSRCADAIAKTFPSHDLSLLVPHSAVLMDVVKRSQEAWTARTAQHATLVASHKAAVHALAEDLKSQLHQGGVVDNKMPYGPGQGRTVWDWVPEVIRTTANKM